MMTRRSFAIKVVVRVTHDSIEIVIEIEPP